MTFRRPTLSDRTPGSFITASPLPVAPPGWLTAAEVRRRLDCTQTSVLKLAMLGVIRYADPPGRPFLYHPGDVDRLRAEQDQAAALVQ